MTTTARPAAGSARRGQRLDGMGHVVQRLEVERHVVGVLGELPVGVAHLEPGPVSEPASAALHRASMTDASSLSTPNGQPGVGLRERDARPADAAAEVECGRSVAGEQRRHVGHRRQPLRGQLAEERASVEQSLAEADVVAVLAEADAGPVR